MLVLVIPQIAKTLPIKVICSPKLVPPTQAKKPLVRNLLILLQIELLVRDIENKFLPYANGKEKMQTKKQAGFTLIELMITLVVLVIALSIGVPSFVDWIKSNRLDTATRTLTGAFQLARNEAVSRQTVITIDSGGNWNNGLTMYTDTAAAGNTAYNAAEDTLIKVLDYTMDGITIASTDNNLLSFTSTGLLNEAANSLVMSLCLTSGESDGFQITINTVGRASINNKDDCP